MLIVRIAKCDAHAIENSPKLKGLAAPVKATTRGREESH